MLPDFPGLFEDVNVFLAEWRIRILGVVLIDKLRKTQSTGHTRRATAHNDDVGGHLGAFDAGKGLAENQHSGFKVSRFQRFKRLTVIELIAFTMLV